MRPSVKPWEGWWASGLKNVRFSLLSNFKSFVQFGDLLLGLWAGWGRLRGGGGNKMLKTCHV